MRSRALARTALRLLERLLPLPRADCRPFPHTFFADFPFLAALGRAAAALQRTPGHRRRRPLPRLCRHPRPRRLAARPQGSWSSPAPASSPSPCFTCSSTRPTSTASAASKAPRSSPPSPRCWSHPSSRSGRAASRCPSLGPMATDDQTIGFIGLGVMGAPMARNLLAAGLDVVAWNRSPGPLDELVAAGARGADGPGRGGGRGRRPDLDRQRRRGAARGAGRARGRDRGGAPGLAGDRHEHRLPRARPRAGRGGGGARRRLPRRAGLRRRRRRPRRHALDHGRRRGRRRRAGAAGLRGARLARHPRRRGGRRARSRRPATRSSSRSSSAASPRRWCSARSLASTLRRSSTRSAAAWPPTGSWRSAATTSSSHDFAPGFKVDLHHKDLEIALGASGEVDAPLPLTAEVQQMFRQLRAGGHGDEDDSALLRVAEARAAHRLGDFEKFL